MLKLALSLIFTFALCNLNKLQHKISVWSVSRSFPQVSFVWVFRFTPAWANKRRGPPDAEWPMVQTRVSEADKLTREVRVSVRSASEALDNVRGGHSLASGRVHPVWKGWNCAYMVIYACPEWGSPMSSTDVKLRWVSGVTDLPLASYVSSGTRRADNVV